MNSLLKQKSETPLLLCPDAKFLNVEDEFHCIQFGKFLSSSSHLSPLRRKVNKTNAKFFNKCAVCRDQILHILEPLMYICKEPSCHIQAIQRSFHRECIEPISKHPYHPKHSLRLIFSDPSKICLCCSNFSEWVYNCSRCDFSMCRDCPRTEALLTINHPKRHEHTLLYNYRQTSLICDVCGLNDHRSFMYTCGQCDFVVHKECLDIPSIIRISRHEHRISFNSSLTPEKLTCGVCHRKVDTNYGRYSCVKGCIYGVHSKCATREDVWDGEELEGEPEDPYEDISSFNEISEGVIQHFSHEDHHMKLDEKTDRAFDENKYCQACTLPICDDIIYICMQCNFILHQECAHLPRKKHQVTHPHSLSLQVGHQGCEFFECKACLHISNGFAYFCVEEDCDYMLDVRCASIAEPLDHRCHQHPLFLTFEPRSTQICSVCNKSRGHRLNCGECGFVACFGCATLPNKLRYKHDDDHVLLFNYEEDVSGQYFCEVCEKEADLKKGVYMCHDCNVTLHIKCLLGKDINIMHGVVIEYPQMDVSINLNDRLSRNICRSCEKLCAHRIVYEVSDFEVCSLKCLKVVVIYYSIFS
ncbi:unnamed protein product [Eruca vesicaria subsp. sativa]|uniref:Zinc finger PHD-type domain-containing protein n=1 Tax=Eruca vesicaria subsp. sativa TaxID=29727 RepID=A0ABC8L7U6_ERUVS|nr:unnamed protein product [Eruca vesicaria subsp. sativa]